MNHISHNDLKSSVKDKKKGFIDAEKINHTLFEISSAVNTTHNIEELYHFLYKALNKLLDLPNFFIALYDPKNQTLNFEYFVDEFDEGFPVIEDSDSPNCLTGEVIQNGRALFLKENMLIERNKNQKIGGTVPKVWLGAPITIQEETIGAVCIQHYNAPDYFSHEHLEILVCAATQLATAIERKRIFEVLEREKKIFRLITDNTHSIIFIVSSSWIYEFANAAHKQLNYEPADLYGASFLNLVHPDDTTSLLKFLEEGIQGSLFRSSLTFKMKDPSGNFNRLSGTFETIKDNDGVLNKMIFVGQKETKGREIQPPLKKDHSFSSVSEAVPIKNRTILIIEDEDTVRAMAVKALKSFGYNLLEAGDGEKGLIIYKNNYQKIDAVFLDVILPGISGAETFNQMFDLNPNARIIITSGHITSQDQEQMFSKAAAYIEKPYQIRDLKQIFKTVLSR